MSWLRAVGITLSFVLIGAAVGGGLGCFIGTFAPDYYRVVFPWLSESAELKETELWRLGMALGVIQGAIWGAIVGPLVVLLVTWYQVRKLKPGNQP